MNTRGTLGVRSLRELAYTWGRSVIRLMPTALKNSIARLPSLASPVNVWHIAEHGFAYVEVPKVATRSIRAALASVALGDPDVEVERARERIALAAEGHLRKMFPTEIRALSRELPTFAFVRNPLERLRSAYANKSRAHDEDSKRLFRSLGLPPDVSFDRFVRSVAASGDDGCDAHVRSQHTFLVDRRGLVVRHLGRFERLADEWAVLARTFDLPPLPRRNVSEPGVAVYTPATVELAAKRYERDIRVFGYSGEISHLIEAIRG